MGLQLVLLKVDCVFLIAGLPNKIAAIILSEIGNDRFDNGIDHPIRIQATLIRVDVSCAIRLDPV